MKKIFVVIAAVLPFIGPSAMAESIGAEEASDSMRHIGIDEVVVYSQPKETSVLRQQPLAYTAFPQSQIEGMNIRSISDLAQFVPSLSIPHYGSRLTSSVYIRGIGSRINNPAVGMSVDDVPLISKGAFNHHIYHLSRADVLRGPQGTLYGQNTEGGLLRYYTRNPLYYKGTDVSLRLGNGFTRNAEIAHYQKVSDVFAFSAAAFYNGQDGFFKNDFSGAKADKMNEGGGRLRLMFNLTKRWSTDLIADYQYVDQNGFPYGEIDSETGETHNPNTNFQSMYRRHMATVGNNLKYAGDPFIFHSISSWQYQKDVLKMDIDYLPADLMTMNQRQLQNAVTQEFVFRSNDPSRLSRWHWTAGIFGLYQWLKTNAPVFFGDDFNNSMNSVISGAMASAGVTADVSTSLLVPGLFHTPQFNLGIFHESEIDITDRLTATLGLRYDYSNVNVAYQTYAQMPVTVSMNIRGNQIDATRTLLSSLDGKSHANFEQLLPKVALMYKFGAEKMSNVYAQVSKGYRAGGFNIQMFSDILQTELMSNYQGVMRGDYTVEHSAADYENINNTISYKPETSWNFEGGLHHDLFDGLVKLDIAAYWVQIRNQQLSVMAGNYGFGRAMKNAGKSRSKGVEVSLRGLLFDDRLEWSATYSYTRAKFQDYVDSVKVNGTYQAVSYKDNYVPFVPQHSFSVVADYTVPIGLHPHRSLVIGANVNGQGKTYWDEGNTVAQKFYAVLGAHVDFNFSRALSIGIWGRNLTDTKYNTFAIQSSADRVTRTFAQLGNPLQVGVELKLHL